jgi:hypothetical protein
MSIIASRMRQDRLTQRLRLLASNLGKTDRILSGRGDVKVKVVQNERAKKIPGWNDGQTIFLNANAMPDLTKKSALVSMLGLNYHEMAHILFSPRQYKSVLPAQWHLAYNILEDQRIETLFTATYKPAGKMFVQLFLDILMEDQSQWPGIFIMSYGRGFLPKEIRDEFERRFVLPRRRKEAKRLINEYLGFTQDDFYNRSNVVQGVIEQFAKLLQDVRTAMRGNVPENECGGDNPSEGVPDRKQEQEASESASQSREEEEETGEDQSDFWPDEEEDDEENGEDGEPSSSSEEGEDSDSESEDDDSDDEGSSSGEPGEDGDDEEFSDGDSDSGDNDDEDEISGDGNGDGDSEGDDSDGSDDDEGREIEDTSASDEDSEEPQSGNSSDTAEYDDEELESLLEEAKEVAEYDEDVQRETQQASDAMNDISSIDVIDFDGYPHRAETPSSDMVSAFEFVVREFRKLYAEVEPGWMYGSDTGRLNVTRAMSNPEDYDDMFDEWDEGREHDTGLEVVISVDLSSSMSNGNNHAKASQALWVIKRALDDVGAKTTVLGFHESTFGLYDRDHSAEISTWPLFNKLGGSTRPTHSMHLGRRVLTQTDMPNRLFIIITDGGWQIGNSETGQMNEDPYSVYREIPAKRMYIQIGGSLWSNSEAKDTSDVVVNVSNPMDMVPAIEAVIAQMLRDAASRR